jgi:hypothetical protein
MRIHDQIGADAQLIEWHIFLVDDDAHNTLLAVPTTELVAHLGSARTTTKSEM